MQTFSYLQRNIDDKKNIKKFSIFIFSLLYEILTTIFPILPPMLGVAFWIFINNVQKKDFFIILYIFLYTIFFEIDHSLPLFSIVLFYFLTYPFFRKMLKIFSNINILKLFSVIFFYILYPIFLYFLHKVFNTEIFSIGIYYIFYIIFETIILILVV